MNLRCALICGSDAWREVLVQCGIPAVETLRSALDPAWASVLVVDGRLSRQDAGLVRRFLALGGAVIGASGHLSPVIGMGCRREFVRYLLDERDNPWCDLLDLESDCSLAREANRITTDAGVPAVFAGAWGGGYAVLLPFDLQTVWERTDARYRQFPARFDRLPYERVAAVGRAEISRLVTNALAFLHHRRGLPFVHLWPFPDGAPSVFAVRLDTDRASRPQIETFARTSREAGVPFTWFVDAGSQSDFIGVFGSLQDQEIGIHCYRHTVFRSVDDYRIDIRLARTLLGNVGIAPVGYAAPYGVWSEALGEAVDDSRLSYASEFGLGFDGFPFLFRSGTKRFTTPQVPVHPVSTGALRRSGYTPARMVQYYSGVLRRNVAARQPVILLDHPVHGQQEVVEEITRQARESRLLPVTMGGFASWWRQRREVLENIAFRWDGSAVATSGSDGVPPSFVVAESTPEDTRLVRLDAAHPVQSPLTERLSDGRSLDDLRRSREFDLRTAIGVGSTVTLRRAFR
jgi:peptidoglycan/xylan/chitin deacetylase (PgdA/CDA1 family)